MKIRKKTISIILSLVLVFQFTFPVTPGYALSVAGLPMPGMTVGLSKGYAPLLLQGMKIDPQNPFQFDFIMDVGQSKLKGQALQDESTQLIKYFLAANRFQSRHNRILVLLPSKVVAKLSFVDQHFTATRLDSYPGNRTFPSPGSPPKTTFVS